jgi:hypothetical protein
VHILEDDAILSQYVAPAIGLISRMGVFDTFDLVFTETLVPPDLRAIKWMKAIYDKAVAASPLSGFDLANIQIVDLAPLKFSTTSSYVVNPRKIGVMAKLCKQEWDRGPTLPYDLFLRREVQQGRLRAACLLPFVTSVNLGGRTTISNRTDRAGRGNNQKGMGGRRDGTRESGLVLAIIRYSFFIGRDLENYAGPILAEILDRTVNQDNDPQRDLIAKALGFVISDWYEQF